MRRSISWIVVVVIFGGIGLAGFSDSSKAELTESGDGTVTDDDRGDGVALMWLQQSVDEFMTYAEALKWVENLNWNHFAYREDWRLPSALSFKTGLPDTAWLSIDNEWGHLYGEEWNSPAYPEDILPMTGYGSVSGCLWYWTQTDDLDDTSQTYTFFVSWDGIWLNQAFPKSGRACVTAVRGPETLPATPPTACFTASASIVFGSGTVEFDPSCSTDPLYEIHSYLWHIERVDGLYDLILTQTPEVVTHTFTERGSYKVILEVQNTRWASDETEKTIVVLPELKFAQRDVLDLVLISWVAVLTGGIAYWMWRQRQWRERHGGGNDNGD